MSTIAGFLVGIALPILFPKTFEKCRKWLVSKIEDVM